MITLLIVGLIAIILYMLWKNEKQKGTYNPRGSQDKVFIWLLIGLLTIAALFSPKVRERIQGLRQKIKF
jgi:heme/copper-type cytochrome/quinol oxidase subunit 2